MTIHQRDPKQVTIEIEGKIAGQQVPELHRAWQELETALGERLLRVDLRGVTHVDDTGRNLLAEIHAKANAEFLADTPLTKYFADKAQQGKETFLNSVDTSRREL